MNFLIRFLATWLCVGGISAFLGLVLNGFSGAVTWGKWGLLFGVPVGWLITKLTERAGQSGAELFFAGHEGDGTSGHSALRAMAREGRREEACEALLQLGLADDNSALHALISIATQKPILGPQVMKAAQILLRQEKLSANDREHFTKLIKEFSS